MKKCWQVLGLANEMFHQCQEIEMNQWLLHTCTLWVYKGVELIINVVLSMEKFLFKYM